MRLHNNMIAQYLKRVRTEAFKNDGITTFWRLYAIGLAIFFISLMTESIFYLSTTVRIVWIFTGLIIVGIGFFVLLTIFILGLFNQIKRYRWSSLARKIGKLAFEKDDVVINALQLERSLDKSDSIDLSRSYISKIYQQLSNLELNRLFPKQKLFQWKSTTFILLIFLGISILTTWNEATSAMYRWAHPRTEFYAPTPYTLKSKTGDIHLLGGESTSVIVQAIDGEPDSVFLRLTAINPIKDDLILPTNFVLHSSKDSTGSYPFTVENMFQDYSYEAFVPSSHFWEAWDEVVSPEYRIVVTDRPTMEDFTIAVIPPSYSNLPVNIQSSDQAEIRGLKGSTITVTLTSNRKLQKSYLDLEGTTIPLTVRGKRAEGSFTFRSEGIFTVHLLDYRDISNRDPIPFHLLLIPDYPPSLHVLIPEKTSELGDDMLIPTHLDIEDDFGFSNLQVGYEIRRPSYIQAEPFISIFTVPNLSPDDLKQDIKTLWDVGDLGLMPEDEVHFHFELYDNDNISGPKKTISETFIARLPSLADLFESTENEEQIILDESQVNLEEIQSIQEHLEDVENDLIKSENIEWEHRQDLKKILEETKEELAEFEKMAEALETLSETIEKHDLFSPELLKKFEELQQLVQDIISEDLLMNMDDIENALENLNMEDLLGAMEQMAENLDQMEQELDRFLEIFKRIQAEQRIDEINKRLEQLVKEQDILDEKINQTNEETDPSTFTRLKQEENRNSDEFETIRDLMKEAAELMEEFHKQSAEEMNNLSSSELAENTESDLSETSKQLGKENLLSSRQFSQSALNHLQSFQEAAQSIANMFQLETASEMAAKLQSIMRDILLLSKQQELLKNTTSKLPYNSPQFHKMAQHQQRLKDQLSQVMKKILDLSKETFAVTSMMGRMIGATTAHMEESTSQLSQRKRTQAIDSQTNSMKSLNETAQSIFNAMQQMQQGGSASGFEQFLEAMQQMSGQQQGLNNMGMQLALGQMGASMQQSMMQKMLGGQQQVQKSLQQLMDEMSRSGGDQGLGDLGGIAKDVEDVIRDLKNNAYTRRTQERQQRILSRMLDSQTSMTQRGKKEERKSTTATTQNLLSGPSGLPGDLGQRRSLTMEALNRAMGAGYSRDYQTMIRRYFNVLGKQDISDFNNNTTETDTISSGENNE